MALIELWSRDKEQLASKHLQQVIAFAGDGKLGDGTQASSELREFLRVIPSNMLAKYAEECLGEAFQNSGFALQDIVNEIGKRVGFEVSHGRYRGTKSEPGHDGIWRNEKNYNIVVEVKTTDTYRIDLDTIAKYRQTLAKSGKLDLDRSSMLVVVGRQDTGDLEAQIRGSRHAWEMRLISVDALLRMLDLKEEIEDPSIIRKIHQVLVPCEFTRLDQIIEIAFSAAEDIRGPDPVSPPSGEKGEKEKKRVLVSFHNECIARIEKALSMTFIRRTRASFDSSDGSVRLVCAISRYYEKSKRFWFAFHTHQNTFLSQVPNSYVAFGCGSADKLFLIPYHEFRPWLESLYRTDEQNRSYWHVIIRQAVKGFSIEARSGLDSIDISRYLVANQS